MAACSRRETLWSFSFRRYRWGGLKGVGDLLWEVSENWPASGAHPLLQVIFCTKKPPVPRIRLTPMVVVSQVRQKSNNKIARFIDQLAVAVGVFAEYSAGFTR